MQPKNVENRGKDGFKLQTESIENMPLYTAFKISESPTIGKFSKQVGYSQGRVSQLLRENPQKMKEDLKIKLLEIFTTHCSNPQQSTTTNGHSPKQKADGLEQS